MTDSSTVLVEGPWQHRFVPANGSRFHVAIAGPEHEDTPLVVLLHGLPQMWWTWRHQLPVLADAGFRVAAMDLRGCGASDKPPQGYDVPTLCRDVAGVIRSLGAQDAVVVGQGIGGVVAWSMAALQPAHTRAVGAIAAPHPARMHTGAATRPLLTRATARRLAFFQLPWFPERRLTRGDLAARLLAEWGAPGWPAPEVTAMYRAAMQVPFAAHSAMEMVRWLVRSTPRPDGQRYLAAVREPVRVPALQVHGSADRCVPPAVVGHRRHGTPATFETLPGVGHFPTEEAPGEVAAILVDWLRGLD